MKQSTTAILSLCLVTTQATRWGLQSSATEAHRIAELRTSLWDTRTDHHGASTVHVASTDQGEVYRLEMQTLSLWKQRSAQVSVCFLLCLLLCISCCCFSGAGGIPGICCGTVLPLLILIYISLGTSLLYKFAHGELIGSWCVLLVLWAVFMLVTGACLMTLWCFGFAATGALVSWGSAKASGLVSQFGGSTASKLTSPLPGFPAREV
mmetsp:Transcript_32171/g.92555  ORF Transcript_32171/g.92555 Transcript_32171/m.92555 type:complete len:208 (+) Transcript_32171:108-731(+)